MWQNLFSKTFTGAYPVENLPRILIDISRVQALRGVLLDQNFLVGAGLTLTEFKDLCHLMSQQDYFGYLEKFRDHLELVAHIPVRNVSVNRFPISGSTSLHFIYLKNKRKEFT